MSNDIAIKVENLSKRYRIGLKEEMHDTFAGALTDFVTKPIQNLRRLRKLSTFEDGHETQDARRKTQDVRRKTNSDPEDIIWALKDVSFEVKRGEVVGIIGRNGAGKTTLLKILSRITEPTSGRVEINGRVSSLLEVGTGFHPELTGRENIFLNGAILGMTKAEIDRKFDEIVDFSGVEKFIDTPVKRYSSGMRVRLAFSVAAHLEPEILLVDEVLAVGDAAFQKKCLGKMGDVAQEGRTVLFVSHNMGAIARLCPRCILLNDGHIVEQGDSKHVIDRYLSSETPTEAEVEYPSDLTKPVQIRCARLLDSSGSPSTELDRTRPFRINTEIEANRDASRVVLAIVLETIAGTRICESRLADEMQEYLSLQAGDTFQAEVEFPGNLLNIGSYKIRVGVGSQDDSPAHHDSHWPFTFRINDLGDLHRFSGKDHAGVLALPLSWRVHKAMQ